MVARLNGVQKVVSLKSHRPDHDIFLRKFAVMRTDDGNGYPIQNHRGRRHRIWARLLNELRSWIRDGRVAGMTKVWRSDLLIWSAADRYTELLDDPARLNASVAADRALAPVGFWPRFGAYVIDHILLAILFVAI